METAYSPKQFGHMIGRSVNTLQKWDRKGILKAHRSLTNRRFYTHDQYLAYRGLLAQASGKVIVYAMVSRAGQKPDLANHTLSHHSVVVCCPDHPRARYESGERFYNCVTRRRIRWRLCVNTAHGRASSRTSGLKRLVAG